MSSIVDERLLVRSVDDLYLSTRSANVLWKAGIVFFGDLVQLTERELMAIPRCGRRSIAEIKELLQHEGLALGMRLAEWPTLRLVAEERAAAEERARVERDAAEAKAAEAARAEREAAATKAAAEAAERLRSRGSARERGGRFYASVRFGKGDRLEFRVPFAKSLQDAETRSHVMAEVADALTSGGRRDLVRATVRKIAEAGSDRRLTKVRAAAQAIVDGAIKAGHARDITFRQWGERYTSGALSDLWPDHVKRKDWNDDRARLTRYVYPLVGDVPITAFSFEAASLVLSKLPAKRVRREATRRHVAQIMGRLMHLAVFPGKLIPTTPLPRGWLPKITDRRMYSCLYPREEAKLLAHDPTSIAFRLFCGVLNREGMRLSELLDSTWAQWNLVEGTFRVEKSKTGDPRFWAVREDVAEAMWMWRERLGGDAAPPPFAVLLEEISDRTKIAEVFRAALRAAGVDRAELFETTEHAGRLRAHDMRATFVTVSIAEGRTSEWIRDRTAHRSTSMIDRYRRTARQFTELRLGSLVDLPAALGWRKGGGKVDDFGGAGGPVSPRKYRRRDLNPHAQRAADFESDGAFPGVTDRLDFQAEPDVARRRETAFRHLSATPGATSEDASGGPGDLEHEGSTDDAPAPPRARIEVDGVVVGEAEGAPDELAAELARTPGVRKVLGAAVAEGGRLHFVGRRR